MCNGRVYVFTTIISAFYLKNILPTFFVLEMLGPGSKPDSNSGKRLHFDWQKPSVLTVTNPLLKINYGTYYTSQTLNLFFFTGTVLFHESFFIGIVDIILAKGSR